MYYIFQDTKTFIKVKTKREAKLFSQRDNCKVFKKVNGISNPWFVHPVDGDIVRKNIILTPSEMDRTLKRHFR